MTCSQASWPWRKLFPSMASAENSLHTSQKRLWVSLRCRQGSRRPRDFFRCSRWAGRVWLTFRRLLSRETESEQTRHFYASLLDYSTVCSTIEDENRVLDLVFARKRTDWQLMQRSELSSFMDDRCVQETTKKKKGSVPIRRGGGGGDAAGGRVSESVPS